MSSLLCSITVLAAAGSGSVNPQLHQVKRVYILAMGSGMDQFLANQLTKAGIFEVVIDPKSADAIVTDNVGEQFEKKLDDLYPPPPKAPLQAKSATDATKPAADAGSTVDVGDSSPDGKPSSKEAVDFSGGGNRINSIGRGKGNYFVVDRNSRAVLWSIYERPKNSSPGELTKTAGKVVQRLKDDLSEKKPAE